MTEDNWVKRAEAALRGQAVDGVDVAPLKRPPVLDSTGIRAVLAPFVAGFMWAGAIFRETLEQNPLDSMALLLRLLALAFTARAVLMLILLGRRMRAALQTSRYGLAIAEEGLLLRTPKADFAVPRQDVLEIRTHGDWRKRRGREWTDVYVVTQPSSGRSHLAIPPFFTDSPAILGEQLMRWLGPVEPPPAPEYPDPAALASKVFDEAAGGLVPPGGTVLKHGNRWLQRGPYATVLLGVAVLYGFLRLGPEARQALGFTAPAVIAFSLAFVPLVWYLLVRVDIAPRKGIALILTPAEMMMRTRSGVHRVRWSNLGKLEITSRRSWSILWGQQEVRSLVVERKNADSITYVEAFLGAPAEVVASLCEAYRKGRVRLPG